MTSTSPAVASSDSNAVTPMLALIRNGLPPYVAGLLRISATRSSAAARASSTPTADSSTANSSPPSRATTSLDRNRLRSTRATWTSTAWPAAWPAESLIPLKLSMSMLSTALWAA